MPISFQESDASNPACRSSRSSATAWKELQVLLLKMRNTSQNPRKKPGKELLHQHKKEGSEFIFNLDRHGLSGSTLAVAFIMAGPSKAESLSKLHEMWVLLSTQKALTMQSARGCWQRVQDRCILPIAKCEKLIEYSFYV